MGSDVSMDDFIGPCHLWADSTLRGFEKDDVDIIIINDSLIFHSGG